MRSTELAVPVENTVRALRRLAPGARLRRPGTPELRAVAGALRDCAPPELAGVHPGPVVRVVLADQLRALDRAMTGFFGAEASGPEAARLVRAARYSRVRRARPLRDRLATEPGLRAAALAWAKVRGYRILAAELSAVGVVPEVEDGRFAAELAVAALLPRAEAGSGGREVLLPWPEGGLEAGGGGRAGLPPMPGGGSGPSAGGAPWAGDSAGAGAGGAPRVGGPADSEGGAGLPPRDSAGSPPGSPPVSGADGVRWVGGPADSPSGPAAGGGDGSGLPSGSAAGGGGGSGLPPGSATGGGDGSGLPPGPEAGGSGRSGASVPPPAGAGAGASGASWAGDPPCRSTAGAPGGGSFLQVRSVRVTDHGFLVDVHADPPVDLVADRDGVTLRALWWNGLGRVVDDLGHEYLVLAKDHDAGGIVRHWCHPRLAPGARVLRLESAGYRGERVRLEPAEAGTCAEVLVKLELTVRLGG